MSGASNPFLVGIAGGTGSGKSTLARALAGRYAAAGAALVEQDAYYLDRSHLSREERAALNFDEPAAVDFELLARDLRRLAQGVAIEKPHYSFVEHARTGEFERVVGRGVPDLGFEAERLARLALDAGLAGVVASGHELGLLREAFGPGPRIAVPGIRAPGETAGDQARTLPAAEAVRRGATYLVVGRPITRAADPVRVYQRLVESL